jgi:hypothetical protein
MTQRFVTHELVNELEDIALSSVSLRAATAFWTLEYGNYICAPLQELLKKNDSFFISDVSVPTNVANVVEFARRECNMYFYLKRLMNDALYKYHHLLHSKIMLFESIIPNQAILVIGSHNMTFRAMSGLGNKEASMIIYLEKNEALYSEVSNYLNEIKRQSHKVDPNLIDVYHLLQGEDPEEFIFSVPLIHIVSNDDNYTDLLKRDSSVLLLGINDNEYNYSEHIKDQRRKIALFVFNSETEETKIVLCNIKSSGAIDINQPDTYSKEYEPRMFFFIGLTKDSGASSPAYLHDKREISKQLFYHSEFHAELYVDCIYSDVYLPPKKSYRSELNPWKEVLPTLETDMYQEFAEFKVVMTSDRQDWKIQEVDSNFLNENYLKEIQKRILKIKRMCENPDVILVSPDYVEAQKEILDTIITSELNEEARLCNLYKIEKLLYEIYSKHTHGAARRNHKVIKQHLLFSEDKEIFE